MNARVPIAPEEAPYTMGEVTVMLDCDEGTVVERIRRGEFAATKIGRSWIFPREAFHESLNDLARMEAASRRAEADARSKTRTAISQAKKPGASRARPAPPLPSAPR